MARTKRRDPRRGGAGKRLGSSGEPPLFVGAEKSPSGGHGSRAARGRAKSMGMVIVREQAGNGLEESAGAGARRLIESSGAASGTHIGE